jgi:UDP-N-acetylmuramate dehydrogenase
VAQTRVSLGDSLRQAGFRGKLLCEEPLAPYTTWRIGGAAELLAVPSDRDDVVLALRWADSAGVPWRVLGNGSNLLVADAGIRGLVLRIRRALDETDWLEDGVRAGAGVSLPALAAEAAKRGFSGLEFAAGIPGTLGGAVLMNAGWHQHEIGNVVEAVDYAESDGSLTRYPGRDCAFRYRGSRFRGGRGVLLGVELRFRADRPETITARMDEFAASRRANQPTELPSCGSVFLKPEGDFAGRLIEQAGLKGLRVGDLQVSPKHANFFVNLGRGTAADALALVERVEREVLRRFGVRLQREFEYWS